MSNSAGVAPRPLIVEGSARFGGVSTRTLEVAGEGPTIVLFHGFSDSADTWRPVLAELARLGRRGIAVDLPGHGHADPAALPFVANLDAFADAVIREVADSSGVVLAGNSLGGLVSLRAGSRSGLPIRAVVGIGPAGFTYGWRLRVLAAVVPSLDPVLRVVDRTPVPDGVIRRGALRVHRRVIVPTREESEHARRYAGHFAGMRDVARFRGYLVALSRELPADPIVPADLQVPVALIWGLRDRLTLVRSAPKFMAAAPQVTLEVLERSGHCPQLQEPARVAQSIASAATRPLAKP